jgi:hypothetical protein
MWKVFLFVSDLLFCLFVLIPMGMVTFLYQFLRNYGKTRVQLQREKFEQLYLELERTHPDQAMLIMLDGMINAAHILQPNNPENLEFKDYVLQRLKHLRNRKNWELSDDITKINK